MSLIGDGYAGLAIFYNPSKFCIKCCNFLRPDRNEISTPIGAWKCNRSNNYFEIPKKLWRSIYRYMYIKYSILVILVLREKSIFSCVMFMIIHIARILSLRFVARNYEFNHVFWTFFFSSGQFTLIDNGIELIYEMDQWGQVTFSTLSQQFFSSVAKRD